MKKPTTAMAMRQRFGALMMDARKARGFTLDGVARKVGTYKGYLSAVERGKAPIPRPKIVRRWAKVIDVPLARALAFRQLSDLPEELPLTELETVIGAYLGEITPKPAATSETPAPVEKAG